MGLRVTVAADVHVLAESFDRNVVCVLKRSSCCLQMIVLTREDAPTSRFGRLDIDNSSWLQLHRWRWMC